ncbi:MAG: hypothetical protein WCY21_05560 [Candidatus Cloacimonadaceae bacterium]|jgi:hypothetical protein|nr:hypothetical protein [Candidatus Cloacimonadota bacterium]MDX9949146.1 hypothetical protein [Candidatus Syntrophosphaera sp.]
MEKLMILLVIGFLLAIGVLKAEDLIDPASFWEGDYCVQKTAQTPAAGASSIRAQVEGQWQEFPLVDFPVEFWEWNCSRRQEYLEIFREMLEKGPEATRSPQLSGPHNGIVATWAANRKDSRFKLNNAVKGMGFLPPEERIGELIKLLQDKMDAGMAEKLDILDSLYTHATKNFSPNRLGSLELYSQPGTTTQTFLNQMLEPSCVTVWLDIPTYKIKQIARLLHPLDPNLSQYEKDVVSYINLVHSFFHGEFPRDYIAVIYYNVEIYDSSPGKKGAMGTKISP